MTKSSIRLPEVPKEKDYEDFIAAFLQAAGYYIEKNIVEKDVAEILELDIIATCFDIEYPDPILIEIKSGKWGFSDVFKIRGWLDYTIFDSGFLIVRNNRDHIDFYQEKARKIGVEIILNENLQDTAAALEPFIDKKTIDLRDINTLRFSYWVERNLLRYLNVLKKSNKAVNCYKALEDYYFKISSEIFLSKNLLDRVAKLYEAFQLYPRISAKCSNELSGRNFDEDVSNITASHFGDTYNHNNLNVFQISTFIEHYARVTILKTCIEYLMCKEVTEDDKTRDYEKIIGRMFSKLSFLPKSFENAVKEISTHKYFSKYPVFWQWFLYGFGGFILDDLKDKEYQLLSEKTGVPLDEIDNAFDAYGLLFPNNEGWFLNVPNTNIRALKLFSVPFRGIGANLRRYYYTSNQSFEELKDQLNGGYTYNDLLSWNNLTVEVLRKKY